MSLINCIATNKSTQDVVLQFFNLNFSCSEKKRKWYINFMFPKCNCSEDALFFFIIMCAHLVCWVCILMNHIPDFWNCSLYNQFVTVSSLNQPDFFYSHLWPPTMLNIFCLLLYEKFCLYFPFRPHWTNLMVNHLRSYFIIFNSFFVWNVYLLQ